MIEIGDMVIVENNFDNRKNKCKPFIGKVWGIYDRYFIVECDKGYRESFLKSDIVIGRLTVKLTNESKDMEISKQVWLESF